MVLCNSLLLRNFLSLHIQSSFSAHTIFFLCIYCTCSMTSKPAWTQTVGKSCPPTHINLACTYVRTLLLSTCTCIYVRIHTYVRTYRSGRRWPHSVIKQQLFPLQLATTVSQEALCTYVHICHSFPVSWFTTQYQINFSSFMLTISWLNLWYSNTPNWW